MTAPKRVVGVSTVVFDHLPVAEAVRALAGLGVHHVEPAYIGGFSRFEEADLTPAAGRSLRRAAAGVDFPTIALHCDLGAPEAVATLTRRIRFAAEAGAARLVTNASDLRHLDQARRTVETLLPEIERAGLVLAVENPGHGADAITGDPAGHLAFVQGFGSAAVQVNLDLCNVHSYSHGRVGPGNLGPSLAAAGSLHLKDIATSGADWRFCALGAGEVPLRDLSPPRGVPVVLELPLGLWRPGKGDPQRLPLPPDPAAREAAVVASLTELGALK